MISREQAIEIIEKLRASKPAQIFQNVSDMDAGMKFVLMFLSESSKEVYASTISEKMNISRARVAVLLKKMEFKGLITKTSSKTDARIEVINMTKEGLKTINLIKEKAIKNVVKVIEKIGINKLNDFLDTAFSIKSILEE